MANKSSKKAQWLTAEGLEQIRGWCRRGLTEDQIAKNIGITRQTLWAWKKQHLTLDNALKESKDFVDTQVESALLKRALGYECEDVKEVQYIDKETGELRTVKREITRKSFAPDPTSMIFWLKNRRPDLWRDKVAEESDSTENHLSSFFDALADSVKQSNNDGGDDNVTD